MKQRVPTEKVIENLKSKAADQMYYINQLDTSIKKVIDNPIAVSTITMEKLGIVG